MDRLINYLPENAFPYVKELLIDSQVQLKVVRGRLSKYGDYRPGKGLQADKITVNGDLNRFSFLITLIHELAHAYAFKKHGRRIQPHGKEWKMTFQKIMDPLLTITIFPPEILAPLQLHMSNPKASTSTDSNLLRTLKKFDKQSVRVYLEDIPEGSKFQLQNGRIFVKGIKKRKKLFMRCC